MRCIVLGAGGFIGGHLVQRLKAEGHFVRGVDVKPRSASWWQDVSDEVYSVDLRSGLYARNAIAGQWDECYQLAADMGGMGFIHSSELECLTHNVQINLNCLAAAARTNIPRYFFSSSVCVYPDTFIPGQFDSVQDAWGEEAAYPALPDNEYGWEKLYSERVALAYARRTPMKVRIGRFENCYGPHGTWTGGREKAPAALCRKVAEAKDGGEIEIWGDGSAVRSFVYVDDLVDAVVRLMRCNETRPTNIGMEERTTISGLVSVITGIANKRVSLRSVPGPVGVQSRHFSHDRMRALGWAPKVDLTEGLSRTYKWIAEQVARSREVTPC